ncbi:MAG: orotate phosphoribosyltransferase [Candidatus Eisenbacteria bacterium]|nr:orotate phosphoribosyltransferase [Candidatus Eisenbacteria bacterium]
MSDTDRERLAELIRTHCISYGDFTLSSGRKSSYYLDLRKLSTLPEGAYLLARVLLAMLGEDRADALGGPTIGADPIAGAVAAVSFVERKALPTFMVRKQQKAHGTSAKLEGNFRRGWKVVIVDDVVTTAGSILDAARAAEEEGCVVARTMAVVDREEGGAEEIRRAGYRFDSVFKVSDLLTG